MAKKVILRFKHPVTPEEMLYYSKRVKADIKRDNIIFVSNAVEVFIVEDGDEIRIENEEG